MVTELDGIEELRGVVVLGATNRPDLLDPALMWPGRFDLRVAMTIPDRDARREIFEVHTRQMPLDPEVDLDALAGETEGMTGADIAAICHQAAMAAIRSTLRFRPEGLDGANEVPVTVSAQQFHESLVHVVRPRTRGCPA